jgi:hypothetical protein
MRTHNAKCDVGCQVDGLGSGRRIVRVKLGAHFSEYHRLFLWRQDLRDGTQTSFGKEARLVVWQIQQRIKNFRRQIQQVERLGDSRSGHTQMFGQVRLGGTNALVEKTFENERLLQRINDGRRRFFVGHSWLVVCGFNGRYEKLALVQSRRVNPEGQIEKVRKSFERGEPVYSRHP